MDLDLLVCILVGVVLMSLFLYVFRSLVVCGLGPALGICLYRTYCDNPVVRSAPIVFYVATIRHMTDFFLRRLV